MHYINCILFSKSDDEDMDSDEENIAGKRDVSCVFCLPLSFNFNFSSSLCIASSEEPTVKRGRGRPRDNSLQE